MGPPLGNIMRQVHVQVAQKDDGLAMAVGSRCGKFMHYVTGTVSMYCTAAFVIAAVEVSIRIFITIRN